MLGRPPHCLEDLTFEEADELIRAGAWALLPVGATQAHGPHLPISTDTVVAITAAQRASVLLAQRKTVALVLPALPYSVSEHAAGFAGTIGVGADALTAMVADVISGTARAGFLGVVVCTVRFEAQHIAALGRAVSEARANGIKAMLPDASVVDRGDERVSDACWAGRFETSLVRAGRPFLVREDVAFELSPRPAAHGESFREAAGPRGYLGDPAGATLDEGDAHYRAVAQLYADAVEGLKS